MSDDDDSQKVEKETDCQQFRLTALYKKGPLSNNKKLKHEYLEEEKQEDINIRTFDFQSQQSLNKSSNISSIFKEVHDNIHKNDKNIKNRQEEFWRVMNDQISSPTDKQTNDVSGQEGTPVSMLRIPEKGNNARISDLSCPGSIQNCGIEGQLKSEQIALESIKSPDNGHTEYQFELNQFVKKDENIQQQKQLSPKEMNQTVVAIGETEIQAEKNNKVESLEEEDENFDLNMDESNFRNSYSQTKNQNQCQMDRTQDQNEMKTADSSSILMTPSTLAEQSQYRVREQATPDLELDPINEQDEFEDPLMTSQEDLNISRQIEQNEQHKDYFALTSSNKEQQA